MSVIFEAWLAVTFVFVLVLLVGKAYRADTLTKAMLALWYDLAVITLGIIWLLINSGKDGLAIYVVVNVLLVLCFVVLGRIHRADVKSNVFAALIVLLLDGIDLWCALSIDDPLTAADEALGITRFLLLAGSAALLVWRIALLVRARTPTEDKGDATVEVSHLTKQSRAHTSQGKRSKR